MPFVRIQTNTTVEEPAEILKKLSALAAEKIGKPESYVMTALQDGLPMTFGGGDEALAFIECKSIGLGETQTRAISASLCGFCEQELGIPQDRVYIEFSGARGSMWGWRGGTF